MTEKETTAPAAMTGNAIREALEPCPFCGASAQVVGGKDPFEHYVFGVECSVCPAGMTDFDELHDHGHAARQTEIVAAWNRRARTAYDAIGSGVKALSWSSSMSHGGSVIVGRDPNGIEVARIYYDVNRESFTSPRIVAEQAAAQADFERRVHSCLSTHTAAGAGPVGEAVAATDKALYDLIHPHVFDDGQTRALIMDLRRKGFIARPAEEPGEVERLTRERDAARDRLEKQEEHTFRIVAENDKLRELADAAEELLTVSNLRGETDYLDPLDDPGLWTSRRNEAWSALEKAVVARAALTGDAQEATR